MKKLLILTSLLISGSLWADNEKTCDVGLTDGYIVDSQTEWIKEFCKEKILLTVAGLDSRGINDAIFSFCQWDKFIQTYEVEWEGEEEKVLVLSCLFHLGQIPRDPKMWLR